MAHAPTPYAPPRALFAFPGLAAAAARAPLGGGREALTGALMVARLAAGMRLPHPLTVDARRARAEQAKGWLSALALPAKTRTALLKGIAASAQGDRTVMAEALAGVTDVTASQLDKVARSELSALADRLRQDALVLAGGVD
ncbi:MAG: hypothetical protein KF689_11145 [Gemmatimonadaceae bacterium]|nr:hypothetical protein [Gemmatimonadaceae bacterium]MCW5825849.1 hypothetical protein [Gemmatimonadaceae bacterium]